MLSFRASHGVLPQPEYFQEFLVEHPRLMDANAWMQYYTKDLLFSAEAQESWKLPDIQALPELKHHAKKKVVRDDDRCPSIGTAEVLKRFAYTILKTAKSTNQHRSAVIKETFPAIQSHIVRLRANGFIRTVEPYSETHAYFWTQMLHAAVESVPASSGLDITELSYESFKVMFPELLAADDVWKEYYTAKQWTSIEARRGVVLPKLKPLPDVLQQPELKRVEETVISMLDEKYGDNDKQGSFGPSMEELSMQVRWAVKGLSGSSGDPPDTHAAFLWCIFNHLVDTDPQSTETSLADAAWEAISSLYDQNKVTAAAFWSQLVLASYCKISESFQEEAAQLRANENDQLRMDLFSQFLTASPELVWEELWRLFYTEETWRSMDAGYALLPPDRRPLPAYIVRSNKGSIFR